MLDHVSPSGLDSFFRCGEQYRRTKIEGERIPPGIALVVGGSVHKASEFNFKQKLSTETDVGLEALQDTVATNYAKTLDERGVFLAPDEAPGAKKLLGEGKDTAVGLMKPYHDDFAVYIQPEIIEARTTLDIGIDLPVVAVLDLYTKDKRLSDLKTAARSWSQGKADTSTQATIYREVVKALTGEYPDKITFDILVKTKTPKLQTLETSRTDEDLRIVAKRFRQMIRMVSAGIFPPAEPDGWICSPRFCGFYFTCPYIPAHRKVLPKRST